MPTADAPEGGRPRRNLVAYATKFRRGVGGGFDGGGKRGALRDFWLWRGTRPREAVPMKSGAEAWAGQLRRWFASAARDLPWRRTRDPYAIWVSEIMLQQTQVKTVIPYWERWMKELPDVAALARASEDRVLKLWEGLGYYRRARFLRAGAQAVLDAHGGRFPERLEDILALPGIGRYTAGAIASIAFGLPAPILDGNVIRVLTRLQALPGDPKSKVLSARLWRDAEALVRAAARSGEPGACSALNQALMELGATVCLPRNPRCGECPLAGECRARGAGRAEAYPQIPRRPEATARAFVVLVVVCGDRYCVRQRDVSDVNGGLWEFPSEERTESGASLDPQSVGRRWFGDGLEEWRELGSVRHSITRFRMTQHAFAARLKRMNRRAETVGRWMSLAELDRLAFTAAHRRIARRLMP